MATAYKFPDLTPAPRLPIAAGSLAATYAAAGAADTVAGTFNQLLAEYRAAGQAVAAHVADSPEAEAALPAFDAAWEKLVERRPTSLIDLEEKLRALSSEDVIEVWAVELVLADVRHLVARDVAADDEALTHSRKYVEAFRAYQDFGETTPDEVERAAFDRIMALEDAMPDFPAASLAGVAGKLRTVLRSMMPYAWMDDVLLDPGSERLRQGIEQADVMTRILWSAIGDLNRMTNGAAGAVVGTCPAASMALTNHDAAAGTDQMIEWLQVLRDDADRYIALWRRLFSSIGCGVSVQIEDDGPRLGAHMVMDGDDLARVARRDALIAELDDADMRRPLIDTLMAEGAVHEVQLLKKGRVTSAIRNFLRVEGRIMIDPTGRLSDGPAAPRAWTHGSAEEAERCMAATREFVAVRSRPSAAAHIRRAVQMLGKRNGNGWQVLDGRRAVAAERSLPL